MFLCSQKENKLGYGGYLGTCLILTSVSVGFQKSPSAQLTNRLVNIKDHKQHPCSEIAPTKILCLVSFPSSLFKFLESLIGEQTRTCTSPGKYLIILIIQLSSLSG